VLNCCVQLRMLKGKYNPVQLMKVNGNYNSCKHRQDEEEGQHCPVISSCLSGAVGYEVVLPTIVVGETNSPLLLVQINVH
jgi:hypothetical protein